MNIFIVLYLTTSLIAVPSEVRNEVVQSTNVQTQRSFPEAPSDLTRAYYVDAEEKLVPLPFEKSTTTVNVYAIARNDKTVNVKLNGSKATTLLKTSTPSFYVFVADRMDPPPHLLVRLSRRKSSRQFTIMLTKGRKGYAPLDRQNIRLDYKILERLSVEAGTGRIIFVNYMEVSPRRRLEAGEYAIVGNSLSDLATFSVE